VEQNEESEGDRDDVLSFHGWYVVKW
jgi:hypothetical protein